MIRRLVVALGFWGLTALGMSGAAMAQHKNGWRGQPAPAPTQGQPGWRGSAPQQAGGWRGTPPPARGPAPVRAAPPAPRPGDSHGERPHVEHDGRWVGHDWGRHDARYQVERPWARGRFRGPMGRGHYYRLSGWDAPRHRFLSNNVYFVVGEPDWAYANDWDWNADQITLYDDPDHPGWYLAYNLRLETYVHVQYDGS